MLEDRIARRPPERTATARARIRAALAHGEPLSLRELSVLAGLSERALPAHLDHLRKSARAEGALLTIEAASCVSCGFVFADRTRFTKPSRCPSCRGNRIIPPRFQWQEEG